MKGWKALTLLGLAAFGLLVLVPFHWLRARPLSPR